MNHFVRFWLPVLIYVGVIFVVSSQPYLHAPLNFHNSDKAAHIVEYAILGVLMARAVRAGTTRGALAVGLIVIAVGMGIAASDEIFQSFIPGRESSVRDFLADGAGLVIAQILFVAVLRD